MSRCTFWTVAESEYSVEPFALQDQSAVQSEIWPMRFSSDLADLRLAYVLIR